MRGTVEDVRVYQEETVCGLGRAWINADVSIDEGSSDDAEQLARQLRAAVLRLRGTTQQDPSVGRDLPGAAHMREFAVVEMPWSRTELKGVGQRLANGSSTPEDEECFEALLIAYDEFLQEALVAVDSAVAGCGIGVAVASRTKTRDTLLQKLQREGLALGSIRDIAGVRVTMTDGTLEDQDLIAARIQCLSAYTWKVVDRRVTPTRGYRAVHVIGAKDGMQVEVQVRTPLQDAWAQMYERLGDVLGREVRYGPSDRDEDWEAIAGDETRKPGERMAVLARVLSTNIEAVESRQVDVSTLRSHLRDPTRRDELRQRIAEQDVESSDKLRQQIRNLYLVREQVKELEGMVVETVGHLRGLAGSIEQQHTD